MGRGKPSRRGGGDRGKRMPTRVLEVLRKTYVEFAENTSFHGIKYTVQKDVTLFEKILWLAIVLLGLIGSVFMVRLFWQRYISNPTRSSILTFHAPTTTIPFPAVTICNINRMMSSKVEALVKKLNLDEEYEEEEVLRMFHNVLGYVIPYRSNMSELEVLKRIFEKNELGTMKKVFKKVAQGCKEMLVRCMWEGQLTECSQLFIEIYTTEGVCCSFNYNTKYFSPNRTLYYGYQMGLTVMLDAALENGHYSSLNSSGMKVILHNSEDYPSESNNAKLLEVGQETLVQLTGNQIKCSSGVLELSSEQRQCAYDGEIELDYFRYYSPFNCLTECRMKYIFEKCNCIQFYYPTPPELPVCNISKIECLMDQVVISNDSTFDTKYCKCLVLCEDNYFDIMTSSSNFGQPQHFMSSFLSGVKLAPGNLLLHVYYNSQTQTIILRDTITSTVYLLSSFGGIFSLFLGCSFISGAEILYYLFIRFAIYMRDVNRIKPKRTERLQGPEILLKSKNFPRMQQVYHGQPDAAIAIYSIYRRDTFVN